jgi:hypothetical protein
VRRWFAALLAEIEDIHANGSNALWVFLYGASPICNYVSAA